MTLNRVLHRYDVWDRDLHEEEGGAQAGRANSEEAPRHALTS